MVDFWVLFDYSERFVRAYSGWFRWIASICYILATVILISPEIAAQSVVPFVLYLIGNAVWAVDSFFHKQYQWVWTGSFFVVYDALLVYSRATGVDAIFWVRPVVERLNQILL